MMSGDGWNIRLPMGNGRTMLKQGTTIHMADFAYAFLFASLTVLPWAIFAFIARKSPKAGVIALLFYFGTYICFSLTGKYVVNNHGGSDWKDIGLEG